METLAEAKVYRCLHCQIGREIIEDQIKSTKDLNKGEMAYFLDQVYHWATKQGVMLSVPHESEYAALQNQQER